VRSAGIVETYAAPDSLPGKRHGSRRGQYGSYEYLGGQDLNTGHKGHDGCPQGVLDGDWPSTARTQSCDVATASAT
jgi:hypothetical protein